MRIATTIERRSIVRDLFGAEEKFHSFNTYFKTYDSLTTPQYATVQIDPTALNSHDDIRRLALELRANPQMTRKEFKDKVFSQNLTHAEIIVDQEQAINIAVQLMLMIDCSDKDRHCEGYKIGGFRPVSWDDSERFTDFVRRALPTDVHHQEEVRTAMKEKNALKSWKLKKRAHIKFLPTDNLVEHLLYDPQDNIVRIFRQTAFLKAHLQLSASAPMDYDVAQSLEM
jgi:hypothetical protein